MLGGVLFKGRELILRFDMTGNGMPQKSPYSLGGSLCDFTAINPQISEKLFGILKNKFVADISTRLDSPTIGSYVPFLRKALETNPYIFIYLKFYAECLIACCNDKEQVKPMLSDFLCEEICERFLSEFIPLSSNEKNAEWIGQIILEDLEFRRSRSKAQLKEILTPASEKYTPQQRYFILRSDAKSGLNRKFTMSVASEYDFSLSANLGTVKATLMENDSGILAEYELNNPDDLISLELFTAVSSDLPIKKCRCCGEFFVPAGRSDSEYCSRISFGEDKSCAQIGAMKTYKGKYAENPIYAEYNKAYKRNHARLRNGKLYDEEFTSWSALARQTRDEFIAENKSPEEFKARLMEIEVK